MPPSPNSYWPSSSAPPNAESYSIGDYPTPSLPTTAKLPSVHFTQTTSFPTHQPSCLPPSPDQPAAKPPEPFQSTSLTFIYTFWTALSKIIPFLPPIQCLKCPHLDHLLLMYSCSNRIAHLMEENQPGFTPGDTKRTELLFAYLGISTICCEMGSFTSWFGTWANKVTQQEVLSCY